MKNERFFSMRGRVPAVAIVLVVLVFIYTSYALAANSDPYPLSPIETLGKYVFWDKISEPDRMACVTCHNPKAGWTFGVAGTNKGTVGIPGANPHTIGFLRPPMNAYASFIDDFNGPLCPFGLPGFCGGNFWDGRSEGGDPPVFAATATVHIGTEVFVMANGSYNAGLEAAYGQYLGPVADQAFNPFLNILEQNETIEGVCNQVAESRYAPLFAVVWEEPIDCVDRLEISYKRIPVALSAYQASDEVNNFTSRRDICLQRELAGIDVDDTPGEFPLVCLTDEENYGHDLFYATFLKPLIVDGEVKISNCGFCHSDRPLPPPLADTGNEPFQLYADDGYHNIGIPSNTEIIADGHDPDLGLAGHTGNPGHRGTFKTPSLRNVAKGTGEGFTKAYGHNGWFKSMESIVHFYNTGFIPGATAASFGITRCPDDVVTEKDALKNNCWPAPASDSLLAMPFLLGDLGLTLEDEAALIAYLRTLSDTYTPKAPKPYK
jgi:cytochrome c peroxidase